VTSFSNYPHKLDVHRLAGLAKNLLHALDQCLREIGCRAEQFTRIYDPKFVSFGEEQFLCDSLDLVWAAKANGNEFGLLMEQTLQAEPRRFTLRTTIDEAKDDQVLDALGVLPQFIGGCVGKTAGAQKASAETAKRLRLSIAAIESNVPAKESELRQILDSIRQSIAAIQT
jgi:hypothetical protein